jgi:membrane protease YdiL (CAAX protease family)
MILPGWPSLILLAYTVVLLPLAAIRTGAVIRQTRTSSGQLPLSRQMIWIQTLVSQSVLFVLALVAASSFGYQIFWIPRLAPRDFGAAAVALIVCLFIRVVAKTIRSADERRDLLVYALAPRTWKEALAYTATIGIASVAEEAAYRGVLTVVLTFMTGAPDAAILISAAAFAVAHAAQGVKSGVMIFAIALVMHGLVAVTGTLVLAMAVHAVFDAISAALIAREARELHRPTLPEM